MRTNIVLDEALIKEAFKYSHAKTKRELIHVALKEFVANHARKDLLDLEGQIEFHDDYDYKSSRRSACSR